MRSRALLAATAAAVAVLTCTATVAAPATATPSGAMVVSEAYGGGGNSGATYRNDFIELANRGGSAQGLSTWSVQYLSAGATTNWQATPLTGSAAAGEAYLIGEAAGMGGTTDLPPTQATGSIPMSGIAGTVALVSSQTLLTCKTTTDCAADASIADLVGYGGALVHEGTATGATDNTTSVQRTSAPDTDDNSADFTIAAPTPTSGAAGGPTPIHDIQGSSFVSPLTGADVTDVPGIVTAVRTTGASRGYWLQDPNPDADPVTSEGLFVYTGSAPAVSAGDAVTVSGTVSDFYPLSSGETVATTSNLSVTEIGSATTTIVSTGNALPAPVVISVPSRYAPDLGGGNIENTPISPSRSALDYYESLEGMRVEIDNAQVVGPSNDFGEQFVTSRPYQARTYRGGTELLAEDAIPSGRIEVVSLEGSDPAVDVHDVFSGATIGPLDYSRFGGYTIAASTLGTVTHRGLRPGAARATPTGQLSIATYNVENLAPSDSATKYQRLAAGFVANLAAPDIVAVEEVQDNSGATDNGIVAAYLTLNKLTQAIVAAGGPSYSWRQINPVNDKDGGQPGGNIRVAFLFNAARVSFVGDGVTGVNRSRTATQVLDNGGQAGLTLSPGRIDPTSAVWRTSRKPLVGQFRYNGKDVFVVANHFNSKGGDQNADGRFQYPDRPSELQRAGQAAAVHEFVRSVLDVQPSAEVVVLGDLNDFQFSPALRILETGTAAGTGAPLLTDLITTLPVDQQYTYVFNGVSQVLDHILTTAAITPSYYRAVHINAEYHDQVSDHDPQVLHFVP